MIIIDLDELKIYRGFDYPVSENIIIRHPTLDEICDYGEKEYYSMVHQLCATPQSMKAQLWDINVDYTTISSFELFYSVFCKLYPKERTCILFDDLDFTKFELRQKDDGSILLYQRIKKNIDISNNTSKKSIFYKVINKLRNILGISETKKTITEYEDIIIDEFTYNMITDYLREVHFIPKDEQIPANESTKMALIEDAKEELELNKYKEYHSQLKNLISAMINSDGFKYNYVQVWDMKINAFMDSVKRISKIKNADLLLQSGYSGFGVNLKDIKDKKQLDWLGELN